MKLVLPILLALLAGFALGWFTSSAFRGKNPESSRHEDRAPVDGQRATESKLAEAEKPTSNNAAPSVAPTIFETRASEGLISEALRKYALEEIDGGWHETRKDSLPESLLTRGFSEFEETVRKLPREIGRRLAKRQGQLERLASDDPFAVIDAINEGEMGPRFALVQDEKAFSRFFACAGGHESTGSRSPRTRGPRHP